MREALWYYLQYVRQSSTLVVEPGDAVIVLRPDGSCEASLPEVATDDVPQHAMMGAALMYALQNPELCDIIQQHFVQECSKMLPGQE